MNKKEQLEFELSEGIASLPKAGTNAEGEMLVKYIDVQNKIGEVLWREPTTAGECCPKCDNSYGGGSTMLGRVRICGNRDCICHHSEFPVPEPLELMDDWDGQHMIKRPPTLKEVTDKINELIAYIRHKNL